MGQYRIEIIAVGGHGCERGITDGQTSPGCQRMGCPDCEARRFVRQLQTQGNSVEKAELTHWPGTAGEVRDDLLSGRRTGNF